VFVSRPIAMFLARFVLVAVALGMLISPFSVASVARGDDDPTPFSTADWPSHDWRSPGFVAAVDGMLTIDADDPTASWVRVDLDAESIDTGLPARDESLRSSDFLAAVEFPVIRFESTDVTPVAAGRLRVDGDLYVRDRVGPLTLTARLDHASARHQGVHAWLGLDAGPLDQRVGG